MQGKARFLLTAAWIKSNYVAKFSFSVSRTVSCLLSTTAGFDEVTPRQDFARAVFVPNLTRLERQTGALLLRHEEPFYMVFLLFRDVCLTNSQLFT